MSKPTALSRPRAATAALRVERTIDGKPADAGKELEEARERLLSMEARSRRKLYADKYLWGIYIMLLIFSILELYSASASVVRASNVFSPLIEHITFLGAGLVVVLVMQNIHYKYYRKWAWVIAILSLAAVVYANTKGQVLNGAMRSINLGFATIQPPEIAKLALVLVLARIMAKNQMRLGVTTRGVLLSLAVMLVFCGLLYSNGFTNTFLIVVVATSMFIIGGTQRRKLAFIAVLYAIMACMVYVTKFKKDDTETGTATEMVAQGVVQNGEDAPTDRSEMRIGRFESFMEGVDSNDTITDMNRQVFFAKMSQANGSVVGNWGDRPRWSTSLPLAYSDYIFSIVVEDTGFVGGIALLLLFVLLLARAGVIAAKCTKAFPALLITGCATLIVAQALVHMAIVTGLAPVSGQPLPFISKGGTSVLVMSAAMGMMLSVSKFAIQRTRKKQDANLALKQAVEDSDDSAVNPTNIHVPAEALAEPASSRTYNTTTSSSRKKSQI